MPVEEAPGKLVWIMRFVSSDESKSSSDMYFQNVSTGDDGSEMKLSVSLAFDTEDGQKTDKQSDCCANITKDLGIDYTPSDHTWVGAKLGIFALSSKGCDRERCGYVDFRNFDVKEL